MTAPTVGLCLRCRHQRVVRNTRGSVFSLCRKAKTDPAFPRYPRLPVLSCPGFEQQDEAAVEPGARPHRPAIRG